MRGIILFLLLFSFAVLAYAATTPTYVSPTPANASQVTGIINFNFTFTGTVNWTFVGDGGLGELCAGNNSVSPKNCTWNATAATEGTYAFTLNTTNATNAGDSSLNITTLTVENPINPQFLAPSPSNGSNISGEQIFNFSYSSNANFDVYYSTDGSWNFLGCGVDQTDVPSPQECNVSTTGLADNANYSFNITVQDSDNSTDIDSIVVYNITIDNAFPALSLTGPDNDTAFNTSTVNFNWTMSDAIDTNLTCVFVLDATNNETLYNETNTTKIFADATYNWGVNCTDYTGNTNTSETRTVTVDTTLPLFGQVNITPNSTNNYTNETPSLSLIVNDTNLALCQYHNGNGTWTNLSFTSAGGDLQLCTGAVPAQTNNDQLNFTFRAVDTANNTAITQPQNLTVDTIAPSVNITSPVVGLNITDGESFIVTANITESGANITDGIACNVTINGNNLLSGTVTYSATTGLCNGSVTLTPPSGIANNYVDINELAVRVNDRVNNTGFQNQTIRIDNLGPEVQTAKTNETGDVVESLSQLFVLTVQTFDTSFVKNVTVGNATNVTLTNTSTVFNGSAEVWTSTTNATALGCSGFGICVINVYANDSWGHNSSSSFNITIDNDYPRYQNTGTNASGTVGLKEPVLVYTEWLDYSLNSSVSTTAELRKYDGSSYNTIQTISLNNTLSWSNFTYIPTPTDDEGENLSFNIRYTDFAGRVNTTTNLSFLVVNASPVILSAQVLNLINNYSNETPTFSVRYADEGKGLADSGVVINITGANNTNYTKDGSWVCASESTYNSSYTAESEFMNFTTSSYDATNYSFRVTNITNANSSSATVVLERLKYGRVNSTTFSSWGDSVDYEDIRATLVATSNTSGNKTTFGFVDLGYTENSCNFTATNFVEGVNNLTLLLTDRANNTNTGAVFNWTVDGSRPEIINLSVNGEYIFLNSDFVNSSVNISGNSNIVEVNWSINDTTLNGTMIRFEGDPLAVTIDTTGSAINSTAFSREPGHHLGRIFTYDILDIVFSTTHYYEIYFNGLTNISAIQNRLLADSSSINMNYLNITQNGTDISTIESGYLNGTVGFNISFEASNTEVNVSVQEIDGLLYNWNNSFRFNNFTNNSQVQDTLGINSTFGIFVNDFFDDNNSYQNGSYYFTQFLPENITEPQTNWTFNSSDELLVAIFSIGNVNDAPSYLLSECSGSPPSNVTVTNACYTNTTTNYTIYAPDFSGFTIGSDSGAPTVSATFPSSPVNDSQFTIFLEVIEPSPNTTNFCDYGLYNNVTAVDVQTLTVANFTLNQSRYTLGVPYTQFLNGNLYMLNVTCYDTFGYNDSVSLPFTVTDATPPTITDTNVSNIFSTQADFTAAYTEYGRIRINISTDSNDLSSQTAFGTFGTTTTLTVQDLSPDTVYFYTTEVCDLNGVCATSPSTGANFFRTAEVSSSSGGGGGGGALSEGMVTASYYRGWDVLDQGWLKHGVGDDEIAITRVNVFIENITFNPFVQVSAYYGKPASVPRISPIAYQYLRLEQGGLEGTKYEIEFAVPRLWLSERSSSPERVQFYRMEQGNWSEYPVTILPAEGSNARFRVRLPGFSFFVIKADGVEPVIKNVTNATNITQAVAPTNTTPTIVTAPPEIPEQDESEGTVAGYEKKSVAWWWIIGVILVLITVSGGAWYVLTHKPAEASKQILDPDDPFFKLQQYIAHALERGHAREEIREKLIGAGWDEIIVDEEIESIMAGRV